MISAAENSNKFQKIRFWKEKSVENGFTVGPTSLLLKKKIPRATWSSELFGKFSKKSPHFEEKSFEIANIFLEDLGKFSAFFF